MAEVFGTISAALGVAALFNNCVDSFEYIQLGRHFGADYTRCQLRLAIAETRLRRWGQAVKINDDPRFDSSAPQDKPVQLAQSILEELVILFEGARKTSWRYEQDAAQQDLVLLGENDMQPTGRGVYNRLKDAARRKQKHTGLVKKTAWALYDGKNFEKMIDQIVEFVDALEKEFPVGAARRLVEIEIEEMRDEPSLALLKDAAAGIDVVMSDVAAQKIDAIAGRNSAKDVRTVDNARVQLGHTFATAVLAGGMHIRDETMNSAGVITASGDSVVQVGNAYGGSGFWDGRQRRP